MLSGGFEGPRRLFHVRQVCLANGGLHRDSDGSNVKAKRCGEGRNKRTFCSRKPWILPSLQMGSNACPVLAGCRRRWISAHPRPARPKHTNKRQDVSRYIKYGEQNRQKSSCECLSQNNSHGESQFEGVSDIFSQHQVAPCGLNNSYIQECVSVTRRHVHSSSVTERVN